MFSVTIQTGFVISDPLAAVLLSVFEGFAVDTSDLVPVFGSCNCYWIWRYRPGSCLGLVYGKFVPCFGCFSSVQLQLHLLLQPVPVEWWLQVSLNRLPRGVYWPVCIPHKYPRLSVFVVGVLAWLIEEGLPEKAVGPQTSCSSAWSGWCKQSWCCYCRAC